MNKEKQIMKLMVSDYELIKKLMLSNGELKMLTEIKALGGLTSSYVSTSNHISIQSASSRLTKLWRKGYVKRINQGAESGGDEYFYTVK